MNKTKGILIITPFFSPNIGGVETHFDDLVKGLDRKNFNIFVQTYSPLTTRNVNWKTKENLGKNIHIRRYRWFGKNIFHKIENFPLFDFLYLTPYLFVRTFIWTFINHKKIDVIHAQGFNAAWIGTILKKIFSKRLVVSTHAIYEINKDSKTAKNIVSILNKSDKILALSKGSQKELSSFGIPHNKIDIFKYWIDLERFKPLDKATLREKLKIENNFSILFIGRLIEKKGIRVLVEVAKQNTDINFIFIGNGPEETYLKNAEKTLTNIKFIGQIPNHYLHEYYNIADLFCIPSQYEEGFGRVVMESVACGLPVIGSNKGGIPEALDESVSILIDPTIQNIHNAIKKIRADDNYKSMAKNCRNYAKNNFSKNNIEKIIKYY